jgi:hypothetical protein
MGLGQGDPAGYLQCPADLSLFAWHERFYNYRLLYIGVSP